MPVSIVLTAAYVTKNNSKINVVPLKSIKMVCSKMIYSGRPGGCPLHIFVLAFAYTACRVRRPRRTVFLSFCYRPIFMLSEAYSAAKHLQFFVKYRDLQRAFLQKSLILFPVLNYQTNATQKNRGLKCLIHHTAFLLLKQSHCYFCLQLYCLA